MKKLVSILIACFPLAIFAQTEPLTKQQDFAQMVGFFGDRVVQLAEAIPEDKYDWAPNDEVRSVGGSIVHIAQGNYFMAMLLDVPPPAGMDLMNMNADDKSKKEIITLLKESITAVQEAGMAFPDEKMMDEFSFPGDTTKYNKGKVFFIANGHLNEHLGQLIAYARMNKITPPWSLQE